MTAGTSSDRTALPAAASREAREERRSAVVEAQVLAGIALAVAVWVTFSPVWFLPYPLTYRGRDAGIWQSWAGLVAVVAAVARFRAPRTAWRSAFVLPVVGVVLVVMPFVPGYTPTGDLAVVWWNLVLSGALLTVVALAGLAQHVVRR